MYNIIIYEDKNGKRELKDYIGFLRKNGNKDTSIKFNKIVAYIRMLQEEGLKLGEPYIKYITEEIWELRPLRSRILFVAHRNNSFILLSIFVKKTQKKPKREIDKAMRYLKDYIDRSD